MDLIWAKVLFTVVVFVSFVLVLLIVFNKRNKGNYDDAASSIIDDTDTPEVRPNQSDNGAK